MLIVKDLSVKYPSRFGDVTAISDVDMSIAPGEIHGLVGESGAGKSTVGAAVIGCCQPPAISLEALCCSAIRTCAACQNLRRMRSEAIESL